eukprot:EC097387.1.p2 GENE.EC097387.1~~EC097387.1.p2  ORF type:complete len:100 (-),score=7.09 EC097387.1:106-405(-)
MIKLQQNESGITKTISLTNNLHNLGYQYIFPASYNSYILSKVLQKSPLLANCYQKQQIKIHIIFQSIPKITSWLIVTTNNKKIKQHIILQSTPEITIFD